MKFTNIHQRNYANNYRLLQNLFKAMRKECFSIRKSDLRTELIWGGHIGWTLYKIRYTEVHLKGLQLNGEFYLDLSQNNNHKTQRAIESFERIANRMGFKYYKPAIAPFVHSGKENIFIIDFSTTYRGKITKSLKNILHKLYYK